MDRLVSQRQVARVSGVAVVVLALTALLTVLSGYAQPPQPPPVDEGTGAHIFQLSIVALVPMTLLFLATADWTRPLRSARPLALAAVIVSAAFVALYYGEHYYWYAQH